MVSQEVNIPSPRDTIRIIETPNDFFKVGEQYFVEAVRDFRAVVTKMGSNVAIPFSKVEVVPKYWIAIRCENCSKIICEVDVNTYNPGSVRCLCRHCRSTAVVRGERE